jgi:DNA-binding NarL/FixJ family response regulator
MNLQNFLIADDSPHKIALMELMLKRAQYDGGLVIAHTTEEAKRIIDTKKITHAFIDYYMPSENGPAVIRYLKEKHPHARVALVSSADSAANCTEAKEAGAETCICTTWEADEVEKAFRGVLEEWLGETKE